MDNLVGQQFGNYRLEQFIGSGSFAHVYRGKHLHLNRYAAIKILQMQLTDSDEIRFREEAQTIANLDHPNIIPVLEFGVERNIPFLVMKYAPYGNLRDRHQDSMVPLAVVVTYVKQIADALQYAHDQLVIHRDVKPENMLVDKNNKLMLCDFGVAVVASHINISGMSVQDQAGTPYYMAPEQIRSKPHFASDQYALGIIVYEWLCGEPPFRGNDIADQHLNAPLPSLLEKNPMLLSGVEAVVHKALEKKVGKRYKRVMDFANELEKVTRGSSSPPLVHPVVQLAAQDAIRLPAPGAEFHGEYTEANAVPKQPEPSPVNSAHDQRNRMGFPRRRILAITGLILAGAWIELVQKGLPKAILPLPAATPTPTSFITPTPSVKQTVYYYGNVGAVTSITWSPDGTRIVSCSSDSKFAHIWKSSTGERLNLLTHQSPVTDVAWSPVTGSNKSFIATCSNYHVNIWDGSDKFPGSNVQPIFEGSMDHPRGDAVRALAWSPEGNNLRLVTVGDSGVMRIWLYSDGENPWNRKADIKDFRGSNILDVAWSFQTNTDIIALYTMTTSGSNVRTLNLLNNNTVSGLDSLNAEKHGKSPYTAIVPSSIVWSPPQPDGHLYLAYATLEGTRSVYVQDYSARSDVRIIRGGFSMPSGLQIAPEIQMAWSHDGKYLAAGPWIDKKIGMNGGVAIWTWSAIRNSDNPQPSHVYTLQNQKPMAITALAWSPKNSIQDYRIAAGTSDGSVFIWQGI